METTEIIEEIGKEIVVIESRLSVEEVNELMKDWFVRDGETFTKISEKNRLAWEPTDAEEAYSTFLTKGMDVNYVITRAYELGKSYLLAMNTGIVFNLKLGKKGTGYTDGKTVYISTNVFDDKSIGLGERIDTFIGLTIHEGCHLLYTDFKEYRKASNNIVSSIQNVLEDERIEMKLGEELPGFVRFLEKTKYYFFDHCYMAEKTEEEKLEVFDKIFGIFLHLIRYPRYISHEDISYFGDYLVCIKDVLTPYPTDTREVNKASELIWLILKDLFKEKTKEELEKVRGERGKGAPSEEELEALVEKMLEKASEETADSFKEVFAHISEDEKKEAIPSKSMDKHLPEILEGTLERGHGRAYILKEKDNKAVYDASLRKVSRYVAAIRKVLKYQDKDYKIVHKGMRSGVLDTSKIVEAKQRVTTVYERYGEVKSDKVAMCFLIDQSGSMSGSRIDAARETSILLYEALKNNSSVELFIYGHTADVIETFATQLHVFHEPGYTSKYSLGSVKAMSENRDGDAIREAALRIRKFTQRKCLMFVLSDGQPAASGYHGAIGIRDTRKGVTQVTKMGFDVCQIAISSSYDPKTMFDHHIKLENTNTLAKDLNTFIKKQLIKKQHVRIT